MKLSDFDYDLPKSLIAQEPKKARDHSRLLILSCRFASRATNAAHANNKVKIEHKHFYDVVKYFKKGDVAVLNNSKVFPARLIGQRTGTGGKVEVFLLRQRGGDDHVSGRDVAMQRLYDGGVVWQCMVGGHRRKEGLEIDFQEELKARVLKNNQDGTFNVEFNKFGDELMAVVNRIGITPLPPYIKRRGRDALQCVSTDDDKKYQTVYADKNKIGSVAAPTAGFHFTPELIDKLKKKGVQFEYVTLHVGLGTFAPVKVDDVTKHKMHAEWVEASAETIARLYLAKHEKRRIIAVGTTTVRTLEAIGSELSIINFHPQGTSQLSNNNQFSITKFKKQVSDFHQFVNIFIYPGYKFKIVDAMITNFHLPKSTLLMLVSAFACAEPSRSAGKENIDKAYKTAIKNKYRFYSYGDAMLII